MQQLEWSPVHTEKFWKENVKKFDDNDYRKIINETNQKYKLLKMLILQCFPVLELIKKLVGLLDSDRLKNVAIACYDIGEFCRFHPFGRK